MAAWCRNSVLGQSLVEVLDGMVDVKDLTDEEAISLLTVFDQCFEAALKDAPPSPHYTTDKEANCELRGTIETKNQCGEYWHLTLSNCKLVEAGRETELGKTRLLLVDSTPPPTHKRSRCGQ